MFKHKKVWQMHHCDNDRLADLVELTVGSPLAVKQFPLKKFDSVEHAVESMQWNFPEWMLQIPKAFSWQLEDPYSLVYIVDFKNDQEQRKWLKGPKPRHPAVFYVADRDKFDW
jgi:hypothetical protein